MKKPKTQILALAGPKGVGKSYLANQLADEFEASVISYADPIRDALKAIGVSFDCAKQEEQAPFKQSARFMAQTLGTEWGRCLISDSIWLDLLAERVNATGGLIIIDDVRFDNEARQVKHLGGIVVDLYGYSAFSDLDNHSSEEGISTALVDRLVYNSTKNPTQAFEEIVEIWTKKN